MSTSNGRLQAIMEAGEGWGVVLGGVLVLEARRYSEA